MPKQQPEEPAKPSIDPVPVAVIGASGYSGRELTRLLLRHPSARLLSCYSTGSSSLPLERMPEKSARKVNSRSIADLPERLRDRSYSAVFLATPAEVSMELAAKILEFGVDVIDLSGAFRLPAGDVEQTYQSWYRFAHQRVDLVKQAHYGLQPWAPLTKTEPKHQGPRLIANPGCYATAILLGLLPLLKEKLIEPSSLVIDAKSGTTGAGKKAEEHLLQAEVDGLCLPYRIGRHQHLPEIRQFAERLTGASIEPFFTPHLLNVRRGIIAGLYMRLAPGVGTSEIEASFRSAYADDPLIEFGSAKARPELLNLRRVVGSCRTQIAYEVVGTQLYVFSLLDNLLKGAASQAVENFNQLLGHQASFALTEIEGVL